MPRYQIDEMIDGNLVANHVATAPSSLAALKMITGHSVSEMIVTTHWFRVVDEADRTVHKFSYSDFSE